MDSALLVGHFHDIYTMRLKRIDLTTVGSEELVFDGCWVLGDGCWVLGDGCRIACNDNTKALREGRLAIIDRDIHSSYALGTGAGMDL